MAVILCLVEVSTLKVLITGALPDEVCGPWGAPTMMALEGASTDLDRKITARWVGYAVRKKLLNLHNGWNIDVVPA
jgi:hypothetical protein